MADAKRITRRARIARTFHDGPLQPDTELILDKQASHHLLTVLRTSPGEQLILFNGDGNEYHATLADTAGRSKSKAAHLHITSCQAGLTDSELRITLVQCVSRPERMDISLRQAVELGVSAIQPVYSRHSIKINDEKRAQKKQEHWQSIVISACEQSGRATLPKMANALSYNQWLSLPMPSNHTHFILSPTANESLTLQAHKLLQNSVEPCQVSLIIGPESGLDSDEILQAVDAGARAVNMGNRILRTETAGPAGITLLQCLLGDLR